MTNTCRTAWSGASTPRAASTSAMKGRIYRDALSRPGPMFQGLLVKRSALKRMGPLDEAIVAYQEWDTAIRLARDCEFAFVDEPTFVYDCRSQDTISGNALRAARGYEQVLRKHRTAMLMRAGSSAVSRHYSNLSMLYRKAGHRGLRPSALAIAWGPLRVLDLLKR
jgi:hypothetical protein